MEEGEEATELNIYTDFLRIVLEIVNAILTYALPRNPEVVYALLHRQEVFAPFKDHPRFHELLDNIQVCISCDLCQGLANNIGKPPVAGVAAPLQTKGRDYSLLIIDNFFAVVMITIVGFFMVCRVLLRRAANTMTGDSDSPILE